MILWGLMIFFIVVFAFFSVFGRLLKRMITSSTAQGSGGSCEDRKPIGELGCCDSWMAERTHWWIERWLECRAICLSIYLSIYLQAWTRSYSARHHWKLEVESWKTKLFCETPLILELLNMKNEAILQDILQKWKVECWADSLVQCDLRFSIPSL